MSLIESILLGIIQGLTEFLPVSSSGHLVFSQHLFGMEEPLIAFDIAVHWGTLLAVLLYFWKDVTQIIFQTVSFCLAFFGRGQRSNLKERFPYAILGGQVILASIPTALIGILFEESFEMLFASVTSVGIAWIVMGLLLVASRRIQESKRPLTSMKLREPLFIGFIQGLAIIPGISRSGATILAGLLCGVERKEAARFSFWIAMPAVFGAGLLKMREGVELLEKSPDILMAGFISSAVVGFFAIWILIKIVQRGGFHIFGYYCLLMGLLALYVGRA